MKDTLNHSKQTPYSLIPTDLANYPLLSLEAKGLYLFLLCRSEDWNCTIANIAKVVKEGEDSVQVALQELKQHGWLTYERQSKGGGIYTLNIEPF